MASRLQAPPVVAVVVTCDPGPWLEECLRALDAQDYPNLSFLVIDAGSAEKPNQRVAAVLPDAYVRCLPTNPGFAAAANEALSVVEGASLLLLLCHDDVAPAPDTVRLMVEEAYRSNAGLVAPKLVNWDDPGRLLQVGMSIDKSGAPSPLVDRGELDQEQHDAVRDVFVAPGGCTLVRADLFASLGGFDPAMHLFGEDVDLSWRAQIAGARVVVAPAARVRHLEAMSSGMRSPGGGPPPAGMATLRRQVRPLQLRHRLRAVLKCYSGWHLVRVLPQVLVLAAAEVVFGFVTGHVATARDTMAAWSWNVRDLGDVRAARARVARSRKVSDGEVRRLQARGSARFAGFVRGQLAAQRFRRHARPPLLPRLAARRPDGDEGDVLRLRLAVIGAVAVVLALGSRRLVTGGIPAVHELAPFPDAWSFLRSFLSGWRQSGLGADGAAPPAFALLGLAGVALGGATGLLRTLLVVGALPVGAVGAFRLAAPLGSTRARLAALVVYVAVPLPYNAMANGRLSALLAYAGAPWVLARLLRSTGIAPFGDPDAGPRRALLPLGLLLAPVAALAPPVLVMALVAAAGIAAGALVAGHAARSAAAVATALGAAAVVAVLLFPWSLDFVLPGADVAGLTGAGTPAARAPGFGALLRFETGPLGAPPVGWAFAAAAALPLLVGREWRLAWAARLWVLALTCWGVAWAGGRGWLPVAVPAADVLLAPAAVAVALAVALGVVAFEADVPGYRFGWPQVACGAALVAVLVGTVPVAVSSLEGRWNLPAQDFGDLLSWMPERRADGAFRVLWVGDPEALPLRGWRLGDGVAYATSRDGPPDATDLWPSPAPAATRSIAGALRIVRGSGTTALGHLLAPAAIRYVVVPLRAAPSSGRTERRPPPSDLAAALEGQVDLKRLAGDDAVLVYENAAWAPGRAAVTPEVAVTSRTARLADVRVLELAGSPPVLPARDGPTRFSGPLEAGQHVLLSEGSSSRWQLRVAGRDAPRAEAFGWANLFTAPAEGEATLRYRTPPLRYAAVLAQLALWVVAIRWARARRRGKAPS